MNPFEKAKQLRLQQEDENKKKEEEKKNRNYSKDYEELHWAGVTDKPKVFRIVGNPVEARELPTDAMLVYWSKIINDAGKNWMNIYWPTTPDGELDKDWILYRLHKKVMESQWYDYKPDEVRDPLRPKSNDKGYFVDLHVGKLSHNRIDKNQKEGSKQFGHFYPKKRVLFNVIDRMDDWCVENKHSKILTSSHSPFEFPTEQGPKTIYFTDIGIPEQFYKMLWSQVIEYRGHWDLDLITHKEDKKYILRDGMEDKIKEDIKKLVNVQPLSKLEKTYQLYDFEKLFKPSGYYKLYNGLEKLFKQADLDLNTQFYPELKDLYETEKAAREKENAENNTTQHSTGSPNDDVETDSPEAEAKPSEKTEDKPSRRKPDEAPTSVSVVEQLKALPAWNSLSDQDQASMIANCISVEGEVFKFKDGTNLIACDCGKKIGFPDDVFCCPIDGQIFK